MRPLLAALLLVAAPFAGAQLTAGESRALDDALTLANLRSADLGGVVPPAGAKAAHVAALRDPVAELMEAAARHEEAADDAKTLRAALGLLGAAVPKGGAGAVAEVPTAVPEALRRPVGALVAAVAAANAEVRAATAHLSPDERRLLIETLPRLAADDATLPLDFAKTPATDFATVRRLLDLVDTARIAAAGAALMGAVRENLPALQAAPKRFARLSFPARGVVVELCGDGSDFHSRRDVGLCIDLGGSDRYAGRYGAGVGYTGVLIDLGGNDRYGGPDVNLGAGLLGIGILYDGGGDDVYGVRSAGLGCGIAGLGMLVDAGGDDRYRVGGLGIGAGARGVGLVVDRLGDDAYEAGRCGEGFGALAGVGWLAESAGNEVYRGGTEVQAAGRENGFGLLSDLAGDDLYRARSGQAMAAGGFASLGDLRGDDDYTADRGQGLASAGGAAFLVDGAGDDAYLLRRGPGQAGAFGAVAVLLDREGDDVYGGTDGPPAFALGGGVAILLEAEGEDRYLASAPPRRGEDGVSLWADASGRDRYGDGRADAQAAAGEGLAAYDALGAAEAPPVEPPPAPGSLPAPPAEELRRLRRQATDGPDRAAALARLVGIGLPALESLASDPDPDGEAAFVAVAARLGDVAAPTVARLVASPDACLVRLGLATAGFVPLPAEAVVAALERPETAKAATLAAGRARVGAAVPALMGMALADPRAALPALALIGDPQAAPTGAALLDHPDLAVRRAAFRVALLRPETAQAAGERLAREAVPFRQRVGLALLGAVGTPAALATVGEALKGGREAKIGALLALDGHVPVGLVAAVEALRRDPDPLVRAVAERIDAG